MLHATTPIACRQSIAQKFITRDKNISSVGIVGKETKRRWKIMFDKFEDRGSRFGWNSVYAQRDYKRRQSSERRKQRIEAIPETNRLLCQACRGIGGEFEPVLGCHGQGPWYDCGWCDGLGKLLPWERGHFLRIMKEEKRAAIMEKMRNQEAVSN